MKSKELRIGNLLFYGEEIKEVSTVHQDDTIRFKDKEKGSIGCFSTDLLSIKPIPLTEECVFDLDDKYWDFVGYGTRLIYHDRLHPAIKIEKTKTQWVFYFNDELINFKDCLHEAQNLYFALTNQELISKINETNS